MFDSREEKLIFKNFCQSIIDNPRAIDAQPHTKEAQHLWCSDWEIIEILKYCFNGHEGYIGDPPPNRLKNNPLWSKERIILISQQLIEEYKTPENIVSFLKKRREEENASRV